MNIHLYRIVRFTATELKVDVADIMSERKPARVVKARQTAMWLVRKVTDLSMTEIGKAFNRDHTTVLYAIRRTEARRKHKVWRELSDDLLARFHDLQARSDAMRRAG